MIYNSPNQSVDIPDVDVTSFVLRHASRLADKPALVSGVDNMAYSYGELQRRIAAAARGLVARQVRKGDVVGMVSPNSPDFAVAFFAALSLGAIPSTVNPASTAEEIGAQFADSRAVLVIASVEMLDKVRDARRIASTIREIIVFGDGFGETAFASLFESDARGGAALEADASRRGAADRDGQYLSAAISPAVDVAVLPYSSGTSGTPKGVMLTHRNIVANLAQVSDVDGMLTESDRIMVVLPMFHIYGMSAVMAAGLACGATAVTLPRFDMDLFLSTIEKYRITFAHVVPPIVLALARHPSVDNYDLSSLHTVFSGAAPLSAELAQECSVRLGARVRQGYGLTETSPVTHFHPIDSDRVAPGSIGPLVSNTEARLVDPLSGFDAEIGAPGELWIRGPQVMKGYFNKPAETSECLSDDGWLKTGDVATVDEHGWFTIVDRVKELIKYKGLQVAPAELEAVLLTHPAVADAAVVPMADFECGELPKAFIVRRADVDESQIMDFVAERVAPYKKIRVVEFVDRIPKSPSGKILRRLLVSHGEPLQARMIKIEPITLESRGIRLEPMSLEHIDGLRDAAADGELWNLWFAAVPAPQETEDYVNRALAMQAEGTRIPWVVREVSSGKVMGTTGYHDIVAPADRVEIGYTWYARSAHKTAVNTICKLMLLANAFDVIGCRVVGFRTDNFNFVSQRAIESLGAKRDGVIRHHQVRRDGTVRDSVVYSILSHEWPDVKRHLELRLCRYQSENTNASTLENNQ